MCSQRNRVEELLRQCCPTQDSKGKTYDAKARNKVVRNVLDNALLFGTNKAFNMDGLPEDSIEVRVDLEASLKCSCTADNEKKVHPDRKHKSEHYVHRYRLCYIADTSQYFCSDRTCRWTQA